MEIEAVLGSRSRVGAQGAVNSSFSSRQVQGEALELCRKYKWAQEGEELPLLPAAVAMPVSSSC